MTFVVKVSVNPEAASPARFASLGRCVASDRVARPPLGTTSGYRRHTQRTAMDAGAAMRSVRYGVAAECSPAELPAGQIRL